MLKPIKPSSLLALIQSGYDASEDPGEVIDLALHHPDRTLVMAKAWQDYANANGVISPTVPTAYSKPVIGRKY